MSEVREKVLAKKGYKQGLRKKKRRIGMDANFTFRKMAKEDKNAVVAMMRTFYSSPAVFTNGSEEIFERDVEVCVEGSPYLEGFVAERDGDLQGYVMIAKSFSTEFGKPCVWIEDLYVKEECRGVGLGKAFMEFITRNYTDCIFRLEVEEENDRAVKLYEKFGFSVLPYMEMKR